MYIQIILRLGSLWWVHVQLIQMWHSELKSSALEEL